MKNIFIEGIQGMGKSTLLNTIHKRNPMYNICLEGDYSPIELAWCTWMNEEEYDQILTQYHDVREDIIKNTTTEDTHRVVTYTKIITDIPNFHKHLETFEIYNGRRSLVDVKHIILSRYQRFNETGYLFECSLLQNIVEDLILFHQLSDDEIIDFYKELYEVIDKDNFILLYLYSSNLKDTIDVIKKERSDDDGNQLWYKIMIDYLLGSPYGKQHNCTGYDDLITHLAHRQQVELRIIKEVIGDKAVILQSKEWDIEEVMAFIK